MKRLKQGRAALISQLYGFTDFAYILGSFPVLRRKELFTFGEYRSHRKTQP